MMDVESVAQVAAEIRDAIQEMPGVSACDFIDNAPNVIGVTMEDEETIYFVSVEPA